LALDSMAARDPLSLPMKPRDEELTRLLREWREMPAAPPDLAENVRHDLEGPVPTWRAEWENWFDFGEHWARFAVGCAVLGVVLGLSGVQWRATRLRERAVREMPARYLHWIDPVAFAEPKVDR
jgi:hypothetical protein